MQASRGMAETRMRAERLGLQLKQDHCWPRLLALLGDGRWHPLRECALACALAPGRLLRLVQHYMRWGAPLQFAHGRGLRLQVVLTPLLPVRGPIATLTCFSTDSTQTQLLRALRRGLRTPLALLAERQHAGRGRHGRSWFTPLGGGIALSLAWPQTLGRMGGWPATLPLRIGVALARVCQRLGVRGIGLKWPNDLVVGGRKLGGILIEAHSSGLVIGVGLNHIWPRAWRFGVGQPVVSLAELLGRRVPSRSRTIRLLLHALQEVMYGKDGDWLEAYTCFDRLAGRHVRISAVGGEDWQGVALGITPAGALRVRTPQGERLCHAGEVSVRLTG